MVAAMSASLPRGTSAAKADRCRAGACSAVSACVRTTLLSRWGLSVSYVYPRLYAVGCILMPPRGCRLTVWFHRVVEVLTYPTDVSATPLPHGLYLRLHFARPGGSMYAANFNCPCRHPARREITRRSFPATTPRLARLVLLRTYPRRRAEPRVGSLISDCSIAFSASGRKTFVKSR